MRFRDMGVRIVLTSCREATPEFLTMGNDKRQPFWQRTYAIPPGMAFLLGMAIGAVVATGRGVYAPQLFLVQETLDSSGDDSAILRIFWLHALALGSAGANGTPSENRQLCCLGVDARIARVVPTGFVGTGRKTRTSLGHHVHGHCVRFIHVRRWHRVGHYSSAQPSRLVNAEVG